MKSKITITFDSNDFVEIFLSVRKNFRKELIEARELYESFKNDNSFPTLKNVWKHRLACAKFYKQILQKL